VIEECISIDDTDCIDLTDDNVSNENICAVYLAYKALEHVTRVFLKREKERIEKKERKKLVMYQQAEQLFGGIIPETYSGSNNDVRRSGRVSKSRL
jgi:hypothetical protein